MKRRGFFKGVFGAAGAVAAAPLVAAVPGAIGGTGSGIAVERKTQKAEPLQPVRVNPQYDDAWYGQTFSASAYFPRLDATWMSVQAGPSVYGEMWLERTMATQQLGVGGQAAELKERPKPAKPSKKGGKR